MNIKAKLQERALDLGFDVCRITQAKLPPETGEKLETSVDQGHHASMQWLADTVDRRKSPDAMWPEAQSAIMLGMNYGPDIDPLSSLDQKSNATISVYAQNRDYHDVIKGKLKTLAGWLAANTNKEVKVFVDTAPLMEKPLAEKSGIGWQGKHTNLVSREFGSWLFLGSILTTAELQADDLEKDHCGSCQSCLDVCPTKAFPAPYQLDARRCISYLTIEHAGPIPIEFREAMGNRVYGCDDCLAVCPWNKYASVAKEAKLSARKDLKSPSLSSLVNLDDAAFRKYFSRSPIKRIKRDRFIRNILIAIGNSGDKNFLEDVARLLKDQSPEVRGAAVWALSRLEAPVKFADFKTKHLAAEYDQSVRNEWEIVHA